MAVERIPKGWRSGGVLLGLMNHPTGVGRISEGQVDVLLGWSINPWNAGRISQGFGWAGITLHWSITPKRWGRVQQGWGG